MQDKPQYDTMSHPLGELILKTLTSIRDYVGKNGTLSHCWWEPKVMQLLENSLLNALKAKHRITTTAQQLSPSISQGN